MSHPSEEEIELYEKHRRNKMDKINDTQQRKNFSMLDYANQVLDPNGYRFEKTKEEMLHAIQEHLDTSVTKTMETLENSDHDTVQQYYYDHVTCAKGLT